MNLRCHRLVFSRRHGMLVAVAETASACGKSASGESTGGARAPEAGSRLGASAAALAGVLSAGSLLAWPAALLLSPAMTQAAGNAPVVFKLAGSRPASTLPQRNTDATRRFVYDPAKGRTSTDLAGTGAVSWTVNESTKTGVFDQGSQARVVVNWDSFDIGAGYTVEFKQSTDTSQYVSALNRIWSGVPSVILGQIKANREVILVNRNGVYFGSGAKVDTSKFIATALNVSDAVFERGIRNVTDGSEVFSAAAVDGYDATDIAATVEVEAGARITSLAGGDVMLIAPKVGNRGRIETPDGQAILAAGEKVYLMSSSDPAQSGLIVAVDAYSGQADATLGTVENTASGSYDETVLKGDGTQALQTRINEIRAERGSVNLVGLAVRQTGVINATTAVKGANGEIYLQAMRTTKALAAGGASETGSAGDRGLTIESGGTVRVGAALGTVEIGAQSVTAVSPETGSASQLVGDTSSNASRIRVEGQAISVGRAASITAAGGNIELLAAASTESMGGGSATRNGLFYASTGTTQAGVDDGSRIVVAPDATISAAGLQNVAVDGQVNQGSMRLFRIELADAPVQRSGVLYRQQVYFDRRDGSAVTVADVTGEAAARTQTARELAATAGNITLASQGALVLGTGATLDASGGSLNYSETVINSSLVTRNGRVMGFASAAAGVQLSSLLDLAQSTVTPAYTEGKNGGTVALSGHAVSVAGANINTGVVTGERQRAGLDARATPGTLRLGRGSGTAQYLSAIKLVDQVRSQVADSVFDDPFNADLTAITAGGTELPLASLAGKTGSLQLSADSITQPVQGTLTLAGGGSLSLLASDQLQLDGSFQAPGGSISLRSLNHLGLSSSSVLSTAGTWTNDTPAAQVAGVTAAQPQTDGGSIALTSAQTLDIAAGATLDVSAGAWLNSGGTLSKGKAGSIALSAASVVRQDAATASLAGVQFKAFDFASGGSLTLATQGLQIGSTAGGAVSDFWLTPDFFSAYGFGSIAVTALGEVRLHSGTTLAPQLRNWVMDADRLIQPSSATALPAQAQFIDRDLAAVAPVNLSLSAALPMSLNFGPGANLVVERGSAIRMDAGASLSLSATQNLEVGVSGGTAGLPAVLEVPGGSLNLSIQGVRGGNDAAEDPFGFLPNQALWLGQDARLSVAGTAVLRRDASSVTTATQLGDSADAERYTGKVLGGGSVTLEAQRGYVVAEAGSTINLDGASALVNYDGLPNAVRVAKSAGSLNVSSAEGFVLDGSISARAPVDAAGQALADGGALNLNLATGGNSTATQGTAYLDDPFSTTPKARRIAVGLYDGLAAAQGASFGADLSQSLDNGVGWVRQSLLADAGFAKLSLGAGNRIGFTQDLSLAMPLGVQLNAPVVAAEAGVQVNLVTAYAQLGDALGSRKAGDLNVDRTAVADTSTALDTALTITAPTIEVYGSWGLQGFSTVSLDAGQARSGEIRFTAPNVLSPEASLQFAGLLALTASQVYSTSGTRYTVTGLDDAAQGGTASTLRVGTGSSGAASLGPLSAFGAFAARATDIEQLGVIRQPFGRIDLEASRTLTLGAGSITTVSGQGLTVPYGNTESVAAWNLPSGAQSDVLPIDKGISLKAAQLQTASSATVDASGGGSVVASEFFAGVGGSTDYFETAGLYAVLPDHLATQALALGGGRLASGQALEFVVTSAGAGLAPGRYTLLPARYALLSDSLAKAAYLVSRAATQGSTVLSSAQQQDDGSAIATGYLTQAGSIAVGAPGERFVIEPAATFRAKSEIRLSDIGELLSSRATTLGNTTPVLPGDAGAVRLVATGSTTTTWQAQLDLQGRGGVAGVLDVSASQLALVDALDKTPEGMLGLKASVLADSQADSVLLGGTRSSVATDSGGSAWQIDASSTQSVLVDLGSQNLNVTELLIAASSSINLADGTRISATGSGLAAQRGLQLQGDGALLALSTHALDVTRTGTSLATGTLSVGANSALSAQQMALDATAGLRLDSSTGLSAQALNLAAPQLVLGGSNGDDGASGFSGSQLSSLRGAEDLVLRAYRSIDFVGNQNWAQRPDGNGTASPSHVFSRLVLDAPTVRGLSAADAGAAVVDIAAQELVVRNSSGGSSTLAGDAGSRLTLQALPPVRYGLTGGLDLGPGQVQLGFDSSLLRSNGDIVLQGEGGTRAQGDLVLQAARVTASTGAVQSLQAANTLQIAQESNGRSLGERVGVGASVTLAASTVLQDGTLDLPGGYISLNASGTAADSVALRFGEGSLTRAAGYVLEAGSDGFEAYGLAGSISASAALGRIDLLGTLDVSAALRSDGSRGAGDAGRISLSATGVGGELRLSSSGSGLLGHAGSGSGDLGGQLTLDLQTQASADALATAAAAGGLDRSFELRVRSGDVVLGSQLSAGTIVMSADAGSLTIDSTLNAASTAGGVVQLYAGGDMVLTSRAVIDAQSSRSGANGGDVLLASTQGTLKLAQDSRILAGGDSSDDGRIVLRAQRGDDGASVKVDALNTANLAAAEVDIEAVRTYTGITRLATGTSTGSNGTLGQTAIANHNTSFMANSATILSALGVDAAESGRVNLRAGVEIQSSGDLTVANDWGLQAQRPGADAGFLTLRAAGNLLVNGSLSDGFTTTTGGVLNDNARSWSMRLVAGADAAAANVLAVKSLESLVTSDGTDTGSLSIAGGKMVRTGAGSIELAAGRDIQFAAATSATATQGQVYVAGRKSAEQAQVLASLFDGQSVDPAITAQGGRLSLEAQRNIVSAEATQLINNWLWRTGNVATSGTSYSGTSQFAWWTQFASFRQSVGSFGGGNVSVSAGGDITNLQVMVPTTAWADSKELASAQLQVRNGGDLTVHAGGDIAGGQYLLGRGTARLHADGSVTTADGNSRATGTQLASLDGQWRVSAGGALTVGSLFNPTVLVPSGSDSRSTLSPYFFTWSDDASLSLNATAGAVSLRSDLGEQLSAYGLFTGSLASPQQLALVMPATLSITSATGEVNLFTTGDQSGALMYGAASGSLRVWSGGDLTLGAPLVMADASPDAWPRFNSPINLGSFINLIGTASSGLVTPLLQGSATGSDLHATDARPALLHTQGSFYNDTSAYLRLPVSVEISAAQDILDLRLTAQHHQGTEVSRITAGRNLLAGLLGNIELAGPGSLVVSAGRELDLQSSAGITTTGNASNNSLPSQGASVSVRSAADGVLDLSVLQASYLDDLGTAGQGNARAASYRELLVAYVGAALKLDGLSYAQAWQLFQAFPATAQAAFGRQVQAQEFNAVYLSAGAVTEASYLAQLEAAFNAQKAALLAAGEAAVAAGTALALPGGETRSGAALASYLGEIRALSFDSVDFSSSAIRQAVTSRIASLNSARQGWSEAVATSLGRNAAYFEALAASSPGSAELAAYRQALQDSGSRLFQDYQRGVMASEMSSAGAAAALFGVKSLPMRLAFYNEGLMAGELAGAGTASTALLQGPQPLFSYTGNLNLTQSGIVTQRGGDIDLVNPGGAINVGLKVAADGNAKGVIARGGGNVFGMSLGDFQVNTQRVMVVGTGNVDIWSTTGDIDSGRGANTAVSSPAPVARRSVDGVVFETPDTTTGSGFAILASAAGVAVGNIGLYPAWGEILALDAYIRAPSITLGSTVQGADNLSAGSLSGATAAVTLPAVSISSPNASTDARAAAVDAGAATAEQRPRNALLTVDLLGIGAAEGAECSEDERRAGRCPPAPAGAAAPASKPGATEPAPCTPVDRAAGRCK